VAFQLSPPSLAQALHFSPSGQSWAQTSHIEQRGTPSRPGTTTQSTPPSTQGMKMQPSPVASELPSVVPVLVEVPVPPVLPVLWVPLTPAVVLPWLVDDMLAELEVASDEVASEVLVALAPVIPGSPGSPA